jgi:hypothetical protein
MFDKDYIESSRVKEGRSTNFDELIESMRQELDMIDFTEDDYNEFSYVDQDQDGSNSAYNLKQQLAHVLKRTPSISRTSPSPLKKLE